MWKRRAKDFIWSLLPHHSTIHQRQGRIFGERIAKPAIVAGFFIYILGELLGEMRKPRCKALPKIGVSIFNGCDNKSDAGILSKSEILGIN